MKRASLFLAAAIVTIANGFELAHAWMNRAGPVDADIVLTQRELRFSYNASNEDSGVALTLSWTDPQSLWQGPGVSWLGVQKLHELGFDTALAPSDPRAFEFYQRQRTRRAFVVLEYNGPAWIERSNFLKRQAEAQPELKNLASQGGVATRLIAIDASANSARLRARHPDRSSVIIVPAVIRIETGPLFTPRGTVRPEPYLMGAIEEIPSSIQIPLPFSDGFRHLPMDPLKPANYRVHLRYGASLEPWVAGVEFMSSAP